MRRTGWWWVAMAVGTVVIGGCTRTPSEERVARGVGVGTGGAAANKTSDGEFAQGVARMSLEATELSRIALNKADSPDIKSFAQTLIDDHATAGKELERMVSGHSIDWPNQLDGKSRELADELADKQGADFDQEYSKAIIERHQDLAARLESRLDVQSLADWKTAAAARTESQALPDPTAEMRDVQIRPLDSGNELTIQINRWAAETYPIVQKHLDTARTLENATKQRSTR